MKPLYRILAPSIFDPSTAEHCALGIMTKAPRAGHVKTRLVPPLTHDEAAQLNTCFLRDTAAAIAKAARGTAQAVAVYTPAGSESVYHTILPLGFNLLSQRGEGFGDRLANAAFDLFRIGFKSVCLIDSDSPTVSVETYERAIRLLSAQGDRVILGPSQDGGYYLIGLTTFQRELFEAIDWSTERVLAQTQMRAKEIGFQIELLPEFYDIDDRAALRRLCQELFGDDANRSIDLAPHTRQFLRAMIGKEGRDRIWPRVLIPAAG